VIILDGKYTEFLEEIKVKKLVRNIEKIGHTSQITLSRFHNSGNHQYSREKGCSISA